MDDLLRRRAATVVISSCGVLTASEKDVLDAVHRALAVERLGHIAPP